MPYSVSVGKQTSLAASSSMSRRASADPKVRQHDTPLPAHPPYPDSRQTSSSAASRSQRALWRGIAGVAQAHELDALHHPAVEDVEAGDDAALEH